MPGMRLLRGTFNVTTTVALDKVQLPEIPGQVVEIRLVQLMVDFLSADEQLSVFLTHEVPPSAAFERAVSGPSIWFESRLYTDSTTPGVLRLIQPPLYYNPPFEVAGPQGINHQLSAGAATIFLTIGYTTRLAGPQEYHILRRLTSFEPA